MGGSHVVAKDYVTQLRSPQTHYEPYADYANPCYGLLAWIDTNPGSNTGSAEYPGTCKLWPEKSFYPAGSPSDVYCASGVFGQHIMVVPEHDLVVVSLGNVVDDSYVGPVMY